MIPVSLKKKPHKQKQNMFFTALIRYYYTLVRLINTCCVYFQMFDIARVLRHDLVQCT